MPATTVYRCDKNADSPDVDGQVCRREVLTDGEQSDGAVSIKLDIVGKHEGKQRGAVVERTFCGPKHMSYWLRLLVKRGLVNPATVEEIDVGDYGSEGEAANQAVA